MACHLNSLCQSLGRLAFISSGGIPFALGILCQIDLKAFSLGNTCLASSIVI